MINIHRIRTIGYVPFAKAVNWDDFWRWRRQVDLKKQRPMKEWTPHDYREVFGSRPNRLRSAGMVTE